jgi:hypothetical protein
MNDETARTLAIRSIDALTNSGEHEPVADTTVVGLDASGYWVTDNGEEVNGLTREQAIEIIVENIAVKSAAATLGRRGGQSTSSAKAEAARRNGKHGGRPRKTTT